MSRRIFATLVCLSLGACASSPPEVAPLEVPPPAPAPGPSQAEVVDEEPLKGPFTPADETALRALVSANNRFAAALYGELRKSEGNLALSPASLAVALGMTYAGARGETADEMKRALALETAPAITHAGFGTLLRAWQIDPKEPFELSVANRLFAGASLTPLPSYRALTKDYYLAPIETVPFESAPESARERINGWVAEQTKKKIDNLLPEGSVDASTRLVLTNAVYFKGTWSAPFDEKATKKAPFRAPSGRIDVPTMHQKAYFRYGEADAAKLLEMPYRGDRWALILALPDDPKGIAALEERFVQGAMASWLEKLQRFEVRVALPRFTIDPPEALALSKPLSALGMKAAFDRGRADLSGIAETSPEERLFVSEVFHEAFVVVDERGTEAAAATGAVVSVTSMPLDPPKEFVADRPFLFFLRDLETGSLLFLGRVVRPR